MTKRIAALALTLAMFAGAALAQSRVPTTMSKVTIAVTNTYQQALARSDARTGCAIQYTGTTAGYVYFGAAAPADNTTSFKLTEGQAIYCGTTGLNATARDSVHVTGTATDVFVVSVQ